jgi:hypothetical protein
VAIIWENLGYETATGQWVWYTRWEWKNGKNREFWSLPEAAPKGSMDKGGGKVHDPGMGEKGEQGKGKRGDATVGEPTNSWKNTGEVKGKEEQPKEKGAGTEGKGAGKEKGGDAGWDQWSEKGAGSEGKGTGKNKGGGGDGGTGASGVSILGTLALNMSRDMFPDIGQEGRTRGEERAYGFYTVPGRFTPEMEFVCNLPQENLARWFGEHNWEGVLKLCVRAPERKGGVYRVTCPVDECNKHWDADSVEDAFVKCDSLFDHIWQRAYTEYGKGLFGSRQKYPSPWWWFQMSAFRKKEQMNN